MIAITKEELDKNTYKPKGIYYKAMTTPKESQQAQKPITELEMQRNQEVLTTPKKTCDCAETSCPKGCTKQHTHKTFFCETCNPPDVTPKEEEEKLIKLVQDSHWSHIDEKGCMCWKPDDFKALALNIRREAIAEERKNIFRKWNKYVNENVGDKHFNRNWLKAQIKEFFSHLTQE